MRVAAGLALLAVAVGAAWLWLGGHHAQLSGWAVAQQRDFQNELARLVMAARRGEGEVVWTLLGASALYGFVHAVGPGHGKFLIGGAAIGSRAPAAGMAVVALVASLAQGATAVALVYGGLGLLSLGAEWAVDATDRVLTPIGYAAIAGIGLILIWRGARALLPRLARPAEPGGRDRVHHHGHDHGNGHGHGHAHGGDADRSCACGHRHAPTAAELAAVRGWRDAVALVAGIAIRPCTGAVMVLVIAWQTGLHALGIGAVLAMAVGTGAVTVAVGLASVALRESSFLAAGGTTARLSLVAPALQLAAGAVVLALSLGLLAASL